LTYDVARIAVLLVVVAASAICDIRSGRIYNWLTYPAALVGLGLAVGYEGMEGVWTALLGLAIGFLPMLVAWVVSGTGGGDAKLMAAVGTLALPEHTLQILVYGLIVAATMAVALMIWHGRVWVTLQRVWLAVVAVVWGGQNRREPIAEAHADTIQPRVQLGVAFFLATCWTLVEEAVGTSMWDAAT